MAEGTNDGNIETYKVEMRRQEMRWRAGFEIIQHSDRAAVDIGLTALKTALLINGGAVVALLAFAGQLWNQEGERMASMLDASVFFLWGLIAAAFAAGVAYLYQSLHSRLAIRNLDEISAGAENLRPEVWTPKLRWTAALIMVGLVAASYVLFLWGAFAAVSAMALA